MSGKLTYKIIQKKDYIRKDGTAALYIQLFLDGNRKRIPLDIFVNPKIFNETKQRVQGTSQLAKDYNLIIGQKISAINNIAINYRLSGVYLTFDQLINDLTNPTAKVDFLMFWQVELGKQKGLLRPGTYRQQYSVLTKLRKFQPSILFQEITEELIQKLVIYCKVELKNKETTVQTTLKSFKKYLHLANKKGIKTKLTYTDISVKSFKGDRTFLDETEIKQLYKYYNSCFISETCKNILDRFLFACFTGLRISDIQNLTDDNIIDEYIAFKSEKTGKFQKIKLNEPAKKFLHKDVVFLGKYTNECINENLKFIAKASQIKKHLTFHVARHSFATNYLIKGGRIENLQKTLGHSNIRETMIYVHIVDAIMNNEMSNLNDII
ncbi:site-specific integrase [Tenacibaculum piscium]|uniref:site-specific integrase n=1 Tax=Tenacibaculum piscium TaxID=1458515 RepID=UPI001F4891C8|nr:site-specific integrase [Tenacibaculum piscium]